MADIWGRIYQDHWRGDLHPHVYHRDDGHTDTAEAASYFVAPRGNADRAALETLTGRVLDLGAGVGSYTRFLEERGLEVVAIDASAGAIAVARERGCRDARVVAIDDVDRTLGTFDAIVCLGNTLGIDATPAAMVARLERLRAVLRGGGRLVVAVLDPLATTNPSHLQYHARNRAAGRPVGLTVARLEYRDELGSWWNLWMPTRDEMREVVAAAGWKIEDAVGEGSSIVYDLRPDPR